MKQRFVIVLLAAVLPALFLLQAPGASAKAQEECRPLVENKCGTCHFVNYICPGQRKNKGQMAWGKVTDDMVGLGAKISKEEKDQLTACLAKPQTNLKDLCANSPK